MKRFVAIRLVSNLKNICNRENVHHGSYLMKGSYKRFMKFQK